MFRKKIKLIHLSLIFLVLISASLAFPQFEPNPNSKPAMQLLDEEAFPGDYTFRFNAARLASGVYYIRLDHEDQVRLQKMIVLK